MPKDDSHELFYWVDDNDRVLGSVERGIAHQNQKMKHRSIFILLFNRNNEILLQKRSQSKDSFPLFWTVSVSGHVVYGQSYDEAALRELKEELGLNLTLQKLSKIYIEEEREFACLYRGDLIDELLIKFDRDEIEQIQWVNLDNLLSFIDKNNLTPSAKRVLRELKII